MACRRGWYPPDRRNADCPALDEADGGAAAVRLLSVDVAARFDAAIDDFFNFETAFACPNDGKSGCDELDARLRGGG